MKKIEYAPWDKWNPRKYLETYFSEMRRDEDETLKFLVSSLQSAKLAKPTRILEFGAGPAVVHALAATPYATAIDIADYLPSNLREIKKWLKKKKNRFKWNTFTEYILKLEGQKTTKEEIEKRNNNLRKKVNKLLLSDATLSFPLRGTQQRYPLIIMIYCVDSATSSKEIWRAYMNNVFNLLTPQGTILIAALRQCSSYKVGRFLFPAANINENDLQSVFLDGGFKKKNVKIQVKKVPECKTEGYSSLLFAKASK